MAEQLSLFAGASHVVANMFLVSPSLLLAILLGVLLHSPWPGQMLACLPLSEHAGLSCCCTYLVPLQALLGPCTLCCPQHVPDNT